MPSARRRARGGSCKCAFRCLQDGHQRHISSVRPALDANPVGIHEGLGFQPVDTSQLVQDFRSAGAAVNDIFKLTAAIVAAPVVQPENDIPLARQELVRKTAPGSCDRLYVRAAIDFDDHRIFSG